MDLMMEKFEFDGFQPDRDLKRAISGTLDAILGSAPSDCEPLARLTRTREGFTGFIRLCSRQGTFLAESVGRTPLEAIAGLKEGIFEQILRWRKLRVCAT